MSISAPPIDPQSLPHRLPRLDPPPLPLAQKELSQKKDFPSVTKLLAGLSFHDETHPDFLIRASRLKGKSPALRCSLLEPIALPSELRASPSQPAPSRSTFENASGCASQLGIFGGSPSSPPSSTLTSPSGSSFSPDSPSESSKATLKRPRVTPEDDSDCEAAAEGLDSPAGLDLRFNWQTKLDHWRPVIARPARVWLARHVEQSGLVEADGEEEHVLMAPRRAGVHQADKRRRFIQSSRFQQVIC